MLDDHANALRVDHVEVQGVPDDVSQLPERGPPQQSQHADELARAPTAVVGFKATTQHREAVSQVPVPQGRAWSNPPGLRSSKAR